MLHIREPEAALDELAKYAISEEALRGLGNKEGEKSLPGKWIIDQGLSEFTADG